MIFRSSDDTPVQAWLMHPAGEPPWPTIVNAHGGPHDVMTDQFNPAAQAWVDEGFAYLDVNFRGSTGRGTAFMQQIWGDVGHWELEDLCAAYAWLLANGIADPTRVFISGESYGGFLTLYALGRRPDLWAAGLARIAIADWTATYQDAAPALQAAFRVWFQGTPDEREELYRDRSPITWAESVSAPELVQQGRNDTRTPPAQMRAYETRLQELGKAITVDWCDVGHNLPGGAAIADWQRRKLEFARSVIGVAQEQTSVLDPYR